MEDSILFYVNFRTFSIADWYVSLFVTDCVEERRSGLFSIRLSFIDLG